MKSAKKPAKPGKRPARKPAGERKPGPADAGTSKSQRVKAGTSKAAAAQRKVDFAHAYVANGRNGTAAAIQVGCPQRGAHVAAARLLKDDKVQALIAKATEKALKKAEFTSEEVVLSMARAVRFDPRKLFTAVLDELGNPVKDENGRPKMRRLETWELDDDTALVIQSIEFDEITVEKQVIGQTMKLKACDRNTARDQAHKFFGHYEKDNAQKTDPITALLAAIEQRAPGFEIKR